MPDTHYLVLNLNRWERTQFQLTWRDRFTALLTGKLGCSEVIEESIGWIPVFTSRAAANRYSLEQHEALQIIEVELLT